MSQFLVGLMIFIARVIDVSFGTLRTMMIVQGRMVAAFVLGFFEVVMWVVVIANVVPLFRESPWLIIYYAFGFSTGNVVGILLERKLALGNVVLQMIADKKGDEILRYLSGTEFSIVHYEAESDKGPVTIINVICPRRKVPAILENACRIDPDLFHTTQASGQTSLTNGRRHGFLATGWRAVAKKK